MLRGERVVHRILGDFANRSAGDNERSLEKEEEERGVSWQIFTRYIYETKIRERCVPHLVE